MLDKIINGLKGVIKTTNLKISDDLIFESAIKIYLSNKINESKRENIREMKNIEKPTEKQINFLKKNGYDGMMPKTKEQAKQLISDYIENTRNY